MYPNLTIFRTFSRSHARDLPANLTWWQRNAQIDRGLVPPTIGPLLGVKKWAIAAMPDTPDHKDVLIR